MLIICNCLCIYLIVDIMYLKWGFPLINLILSYLTSTKDEDIFEVHGRSQFSERNWRRVRVTQPTVSRVVSKMLDVISERAHDWI